MELVFTVRTGEANKTLDQLSFEVPDHEVARFLARLRQTIYAEREDLRTSVRPAAELAPERVRQAAAAERSRESRAAAKHVERKAEAADFAGLRSRMEARERARREAEEERQRLGTPPPRRAVPGK